MREYESWECEYGGGGTVGGRCLGRYETFVRWEGLRRGVDRWWPFGGDHDVGCFYFDVVETVRFHDVSVG